MLCDTSSLLDMHTASMSEVQYKTSMAWEQHDRSTMVVQAQYGKYLAWAQYRIISKKVNVKLSDTCGEHALQLAMLAASWPPVARAEFAGFLCWLTKPSDPPAFELPLQPTRIALLLQLAMSNVNTSFVTVCRAVGMQGLCVTGLSHTATTITIRQTPRAKSLNDGLVSVQCEAKDRS